MKDLALMYRMNGYDCGNCIIKAADTKYSLGLSKELIRGVSAASGGFGCGGLCAACAAVVILFSAIFDEEMAKRLRIEFMQEFSYTFGTLNCCSINVSCEDVISFCAGTADEMIQKNVRQLSR